MRSLPSNKLDYIVLTSMNISKSTTIQTSYNLHHECKSLWNRVENMVIDNAMVTSLKDSFYFFKKFVW